MERVSGWASSASHARDRRERIGRLLLAAVIPLSALALGSLHTPVLAFVAVLAMAATALLWWDAEPLPPRPAATALVATGVFLVGWTLVQVVPLPTAFVRLVAPDNGDVWSRCLSPLHEPGPSFASLSLDPTASRVQILRGVTYLVVFIGALRVARRQDGIAFLERTLLASTVVVAAAALVHPVLGARKVFGVYAPGEAYAYDNRVGPLLNANHLAAYVQIGVVLAFASVIERRHTLPRPLAIAIVLLLGATTVWTLSRGGTAAMVLGVIVVAVMIFGSRRTKRQRIAGPTALAFIGAFGSLVLFVSADDSAIDKLERNDLSKLALVQNALQLVPSHPLFGVGRGAFEATFPKVREGTGYWVFTHPENVVAQWVTEWGVPVAVVAMAVIAWALRPKTPLARSRPPAAPWAVLVAVAVQNLVDFSLEVPGVVIALAICAAIVTGGTGGETIPHRGSGWASRPNLLAGVLGVATLLAVAITVPFSGHELYNEQRAFQKIGLDRSIPRDEFRARAREAMLRHPADPYFPFVGAVRATLVRDESVIPWAGRALERSPVYGRVHLLLARSLFGRNPSQARLEYRTACVQDPGVCAPDEAIRLVEGFDDAMELVPDGPEGLKVLEHLASALERRLPSTVVRLDREIAARDPAALEPVARAAARALGDVRDGEAWCVDAKGSKEGRAACIADGLAAAARLRAAAPDRCDGHAFTAELRVAAGETDAAFADFDGALEEVTERSVCARRLVSLAVQAGNPARADAAIERLLKLGCESPPECVTNLTFAAEVEARRGGSRRALALVKKAWERAPERDDLLADVASRAESLGVHGEALDAYTKLSERHPDAPQWKEAVARERQAVTAGVFQRR